MFRFYALFFLLDLAVLVVALIDCLSVDEGGIRALPRVYWVLLILLFSPIGGIAWFVAGRPTTVVPKPRTWHPGSGFPEAQRPRDLAPDDDPEFLRRLAKTHREDEDLMRRWEEDLRRREEDLRRKETGDGNGAAPKES
jgi:Phospholipase_D-nuclease N-terminal